MKITFDVCERCGKIRNDTKEYKIIAFQDNKADGGYNLCYPCYYKMTQLLNKECYKKGDEIMQDFVMQFNKQFGPQGDNTNGR